MTTKSDVIACSSVVQRHFGEMYCLHLQGQRISQAKNQQEPSISNQKHTVSKQSSVRQLMVAALFLDLFDPVDETEGSSNFYRTTRR
jgi:hypothetical protein